MRSEHRRRALAVAYSSVGFSQICSLLFYYVLYRQLPQEQVGLYSWSMAVVFFFDVPINLGLTWTLAREYSRTDLGIWQAAKSLALVRLPIVVAAVLLWLVWRGTGRPTSQQAWILALACLNQIVVTAGWVFSLWLKGHQHQNLVNVIAALFSLMRLAFGWLLLWVLQDLSLVHLWGGLVFISLASLGTNAFVASKKARLEVGADLTRESPRAENTFALSRRLTKIGLVFFAMNALVTVQNRLDWLLVSSYISLTALASYSLANKFYELIYVFGNIGVGTTYPWMCRDTTNEGVDVQLVRILRGLVFAGTMLSVLGMISLPGLVEWLFPGKYIGSGDLIRLMMLAAGALTAQNVFLRFLASRDVERKVVTAFVVTTAAQLAINLILIPRIGNVGACVGMVVLSYGTLVALSYLIISARIMPRAAVIRMVGFSVCLPVFSYGVTVFVPGQALVLSGVIAAGGLSASWLVLLDNGDRQWLSGQVSSRLERIKLKGTASAF